jgi:hypothetical protein
MVETVKKLSSNRSAKERRNTFFRVLDGVLSMAHRKFHAGGNSNRAELGWPNVPVLVVLFLCLCESHTLHKIKEFLIHSKILYSFFSEFQRSLILN